MKGSLWPWYGNGVCLGTRRVGGCDRAFLNSLRVLLEPYITSLFPVFLSGQNGLRTPC